MICPAEPRDATGDTAGAGRRAVFLDRDGVLNEMVYDTRFGLLDSPLNPEQFRLLPGAAEAVRTINEMGFLALVVSNQPGVAKGKFAPEVLEAITGEMHRQLEKGGARLDAVYYCLHHPEASLVEYREVCDCRKPNPGLLKHAALKLGIDLGSSYMVGDGLTDVLAGKAVGCTTLFLGRHKCDICRLMEEMDAVPDGIATDLLGAVRLVQ
ncbi:MAG: HAD family hydrolase [Chloroflexi bacterium]|nr:HAD family hydrolase [Chloroflexota bacterium]